MGIRVGCRGGHVLCTVTIRVAINRNAVLRFGSVRFRGGGAGVGFCDGDVVVRVARCWL